MANPISFQDLFNFDGASSELKDIIVSLKEFKSVYEEFQTLVVNGNIRNATDQNNALNDSIIQLAATTQKYNISTTEGQKAIVEATATMKGYAESIDELNNSKKSIQALDENLAKTVTTLTTKIQELITVQNGLDKSSDNYVETNKELQGEITKTAQSVTNLGTSMKDITGAFKVAQISNSDFAKSIVADAASLKKMQDELALTQKSLEGVNKSVAGLGTTISTNDKITQALIARQAELIEKEKQLALSVQEASAELKGKQATLNQQITTQQKLNVAESEYGVVLATEKEKLRQLNAENKATAQATLGVGTAMEGATKKASQFENILSRMGLRFIANLVVFQGLMELFSALGDKFKTYSDQMNFAQVTMGKIAEETANNFLDEAVKIGTLKSRFEDATSSIKDKKEALDELNKTAGNQIGAINGINDAEKFFRDKSDAFIQALTLRAKAEAALGVIRANNARLLVLEANPESVLTGFDKIGVAAKTVKDVLTPGTDGDISGTYKFNSIVAGANQADKEMRSLYNSSDLAQKKLTEYANAAAAIDTKFGFNTDQKGKKEKSATGDLRSGTLSLIDAQGKNETDKAALNFSAVQNPDYKATFEYEEKVLAIKEKYADMALQAIKDFHGKTKISDEQELADKLKYENAKIEARKHTNDVLNKLDEQLDAEDKKRSEAAFSELKKTAKSAEDFKNKTAEIDKLYDKLHGNITRDDIKSKNASKISRSLSGILGINKINSKDNDSANAEQQETDRGQIFDDNKLLQQQLDAGDIKSLDTKKKLAQDEIKLQEDTSKRILEAKQREAESKKALEQQAFKYGADLIGSGFQIYKNGLQAQEDAAARNHENLLALAGNNADAQKRINKEYHDEEVSLKRKEAQADKEEALFKVAIDTAKGVAEAIAQVDLYPYNFVLAGIVAASEAAQAAAILSKPLPQYFKGREDGPAEFAELNELGPELIENDGMFRIALGGKKGVGALGAGDKVHTHEQSIGLIRKQMEDQAQADDWLDTLLVGTGTYAQRESEGANKIANAIFKTALSKDTFTDAIVKGFKSAPIELNVITEGSARLDRMHNRHSIVR